MRKSLSLFLISVVLVSTDVFSQTAYYESNLGGDKDFVVNLGAVSTSDWMNYFTLVSGNASDPVKHYTILSGDTLNIGGGSVVNPTTLSFGDDTIIVEGVMGFVPGPYSIAMGASAYIQVPIGGAIGYLEGGIFPPTFYVGDNPNQITISGASPQSGPFKIEGFDEYGAGVEFSSSTFWDPDPVFGSTNWLDPSNWSNGVPSLTKNGIIPDTIDGTAQTIFPVLTTGQDVEARRLVIFQDATLEIQSEAYLTIDRCLSNTGTITVESGGALVQTTTSPITCFEGEFIIRRFVEAGQKFVGSPIDDHSVNGFGVSPSGVNGGQIIPYVTPSPVRCNADSVAPSSPYGNIMELRENATPTDNCTQALWHVKSSGNLENARGYVVNLSGDVTLEFTGTINNGDIDYGGLTRSAPGFIDQFDGNYDPIPQTYGWHLVSNPYPSPIRLSDGDLGPDFDNAVYLYDGTSFTEISLNSTDAVIAVGQGFQIRKSSVGGSATFSLDNGLRETGNPTFYKQSNGLSEFLDVTLEKEQFQSTATLYFEDDATTGFDPKYDANRLFGAKHLPLIYTVEENEELLAYNALPRVEFGSPLSVPMGVYDGTSPGEFTIKFNGINTLSTNVLLEDLKTNTLTPITDGFSYSFTIAKGDTRDRFVLHFKAGETVSSVADLDAENTIELFPNPSESNTTLIFNGNNNYRQVQVLDLSGKLVKEFNLELNAMRYDLSTESFRSGVYFINIIGSEGNNVLKFIKQ